MGIFFRIMSDWWFFFFFFFLFNCVPICWFSAFQDHWVQLHHGSHAWVLSRFSCVQLFATLWSVARQAPPFMGFSRQEYCIGLLCPPLGDLPHPGAALSSLVSPALAFTTSTIWEVLSNFYTAQNPKPGGSAKSEIQAAVTGQCIVLPKGCVPAKGCFSAILLRTKIPQRQKVMGLIGGHPAWDGAFP